MTKRKKSKPTPRARVSGKNASAYKTRLAQLRSITSDFDAKGYSSAYTAKPGKRRKAALAKVSRRFRQLKPYFQRSQKIIKVRAGKNRKRNLEELRRYVGFPRISGLRAIPIETPVPKKTSVSFDRKGRITITKAGAKWKFFKFSRMPRDGYQIENGKKVFRTSADDAVTLMEELLKTKLPQGFYVYMTRHHYLLHGVIERDRLVADLRSLVMGYNSRSPGFAKLIYGVKWIGGSGEAALRRLQDDRNERQKRSDVRRRIKNEKAAREIAAMDKLFRGERLKPLSKRARATGRR